jgi:hypothetical protein
MTVPTLDPRTKRDRASRHHIGKNFYSIGASAAHLTLDLSRTAPGRNCRRGSWVNTGRGINRSVQLHSTKCSTGSAIASSGHLKIYRVIATRCSHTRARRFGYLSEHRKAQAPDAWWQQNPQRLDPRRDAPGGRLTLSAPLGTSNHRPISHRPQGRRRPCYAPVGYMVY